VNSNPPIRGRAAADNRENCGETAQHNRDIDPQISALDKFGDRLLTDRKLRRTHLILNRTHFILDISFTYPIDIYRGCEHGGNCCVGRPAHRMRYNPHCRHRRRHPQEHPFHAHA
jgi:hypothetical protein